MIFSTNNSNKYDSAPDTIEHKNRVQEYMNELTSVITLRSRLHDNSKLFNKEEKEIFDEWSPKLKELKYGSEEYKKALENIKPALDNHYKNNRHHPEHFENGISGMTLVDIVEMLCDWTASCERTKNGDIFQSIELNQKRFGYSDELKQIFINTINEHFQYLKGQNNGD